MPLGLLKTSLVNTELERKPQFPFSQQRSSEDLLGGGGGGCAGGCDEQH